MGLFRRIVLTTVAMMVVQQLAWAATPSKPKVTKQTVSMRTAKGQTLGKADLISTTVNGKTSRVLAVKVANFSLPPGTKLAVKVNGTAVATAKVIEELDNYDVDGDGITNEEDTDDDGDGIPDANDTDDDGDGIPDTEEADADDDGNPDLQDEDDNDDGVPDDELDTDDDGIPDNEDDDDDDDGIPDDEDDDDDGDDVSDEVDDDTAVVTDKIGVVVGSGIPSVTKGSRITVTLPNGTVLASGKF